MILSEKEYLESFLTVDGVIYTPKIELIEEKIDKKKVFSYKVLASAEEVYNEIHCPVSTLEEDVKVEDEIELLEKKVSTLEAKINTLTLLINTKWGL